MYNLAIHSGKIVNRQIKTSEGRQSVEKTRRQKKSHKTLAEKLGFQRVTLWWVFEGFALKGSGEGNQTVQWTVSPFVHIASEPELF